MPAAIEQDVVDALDGIEELLGEYGITGAYCFKRASGQLTTLSVYLLCTPERWASIQQASGGTYPWWLLCLQARLHLALAPVLERHKALWGKNIPLALSAGAMEQYTSPEDALLERLDATAVAPLDNTVVAAARRMGFWNGQRGAFLETLVIPAEEAQRFDGIDRSLTVTRDGWDVNPDLMDLEYIVADLAALASDPPS